MTERFGIQDHDPRLTQHAQQNPTNQGTFRNIGDGGADTPPPSPSGGDFPGPRLIFATLRALRAARKLRRRNLVIAAVLALIFGPFGMIYTTWMGAAIVFGLSALAGYVRGGGMAALDNDVVMQPIWRYAVIVSVIWTLLAARAHNARLKSSQAV
jgi:hypothetical protein